MSKDVLYQKKEGYNYFLFSVPGKHYFVDIYYSSVFDCGAAPQLILGKSVN